MKEGPEHLGVLSGKMTFLLFVVRVSLLQGLGFSFPLLFSAVNLVIEQEALQCQTLDKKPGLKVKSGDNL